VYWVATDQTQEGRPQGECSEGFPRCNRPEDLFFDNQTLRHVTSRDDLTAGTWFFDYEADRIYLYDDPAGHVVETSVTSRAFGGSARDVVIRDLTIEKYASRAQYGAIESDDGTGWTVDNVTLQYNHGAGIRMGSETRLTNSRIVNNGQLGIRAFGENGLIEGNEIAYNNYAGFDSYWEAGGSKFSDTNTLTVRNNYVHHNDGPGLWTDINNINTLYENNLVLYNQRNGIYHEISYAAVISNNVVKFNGLNYDNWLWGSQILIATSSDVEVYGNEVVVSADKGNGIGVVNQDRGNGTYGPWRSYNNYIHDNVIIYLGETGTSGVATDFDNQRFWQEANNRFDHNTYYTLSAEFRHWRWADRELTWTDLTIQGQETNGMLVTGTVPEYAVLIPEWRASTGLASPTEALP
jgi:hypothetical protein